MKYMLYEIMKQMKILFYWLCL